MLESGYFLLWRTADVWFLGTFFRDQKVTSQSMVLSVYFVHKLKEKHPDLAFFFLCSFVDGRASTHEGISYNLTSNTKLFIHSYAVASAFSACVTHLRKEVFPQHVLGNRLGSGMPILREHKRAMV